MAGAPLKPKQLAYFEGQTDRTPSSDTASGGSDNAAAAASSAAASYTLGKFGGLMDSLDEDDEINATELAKWYRSVSLLNIQDSVRVRRAQESRMRTLSSADDQQQAASMQPGPVTHRLLSAPTLEGSREDGLAPDQKNKFWPSGFVDVAGGSVRVVGAGRGRGLCQRPAMPPAIGLGRGGRLGGFIADNAYSPNIQSRNSIISGRPLSQSYGGSSSPVMTGISNMNRSRRNAPTSHVNINELWKRGSSSEMFNKINGMLRLCQMANNNGIECTVVDIRDSFGLLEIVQPKPMTELGGAIPPVLFDCTDVLFNGATLDVHTTMSSAYRNQPLMPALSGLLKVDDRLLIQQIIQTPDRRIFAKRLDWHGNPKELRQFVGHGLVKQIVYEVRDIVSGPQSALIEFRPNKPNIGRSEVFCLTEAFTPFGFGDIRKGDTVIGRWEQKNNHCLALHVRQLKPTFHSVRIPVEVNASLSCFLPSHPRALFGRCHLPELPAPTDVLIPVEQLCGDDRRHTTMTSMELCYRVSTVRLFAVDVVPNIPHSSSGDVNHIRIPFRISQLDVEQLI